jgi:hypothetical protein
MQRQRVTQRTEANVLRPLRDRAEQCERVGIDGELLEEGVFQCTENVKAILVGMLGQRDNIPN